MRTSPPNPDSERPHLTGGTADDTVSMNMMDMLTTGSHVPGDEPSGAATPVIAGDDTTTPRGATMPLHAIPLLPGDTCACGALAEDGRTACRKCAARERWARRHGRHRPAGRSGLATRGRHASSRPARDGDVEDGPR